MQQRFNTLVLGLTTLLFFHAGAQGGDLVSGVYVAEHEFVVTVSPVDQESRNAESSDLYQREDSHDTWVNLGNCRKITLPDGDVRFVRRVEVERDGVYLFISRPVVKGASSTPPETDSLPQARVVVDTLPPTVEITSPDQDTATAGELINPAWLARDENLGDHPVSLSWSADGDDWQVIASALPGESESEWRLPEQLSGPVSLRVSATDLAGNLGETRRQLEVSPLEPTPSVTVVESPATPEKPEVATPDDGDTAQLNRNRSWLYYLMAINLMRQDKPKDALQYYWLAVKEDPELIDAWLDIVLAYTDVGAYQTAREVARQTMDRAPDRFDLMHLMGETFQAEAMRLMSTARTGEERARASDLAHQAVEWYSKALEKASEEWRLAEQAASYYRLGEICYYINMDRDGARAYWYKILDLHSPTPNPDLVLWSGPKDRPLARKRLQNQTYHRVALETWQNWARGYVGQLDERERRGMLDLTPLVKPDVFQEKLASAWGGEYNPDRPDGRSLFSLPSQYGSPSPVPVRDNAARSIPAAPKSEYSIYSHPERVEKTRRPRPSRRSSGLSQFSGGPDVTPSSPPDPYDFPLGGRARPNPAWLGSGPYGDVPGSGEW
ncbi:MAG: tetratricopeptide repeat protein [Planctomycetota bacterium]|jgi:tetratricopeptide (TPR) repeat protein|nr:tetratricopeptide repeat protein [Planctomycetota bacterium]